MTRITLCALALLGYATAARAGELDDNLLPTPANAPTGVVPPKVTGGSELDNESPDPAHCFRGGWGHYGYGFGPAWGGVGFAPVSYGFVGFYRPATFWSPAFSPFPVHTGFSSFSYSGFGGGFGGGYYQSFYSYRGFAPGWGWGWGW